MSIDTQITQLVNAMQANTDAVLALAQGEGTTSADVGKLREEIRAELEPKIVSAAEAKGILNDQIRVAKREAVSSVIKSIAVLLSVHEPDTLVARLMKNPSAKIIEELEAEAKEIAASGSSAAAEDDSDETAAKVKAAVESDRKEKADAKAKAKELEAAEVKAKAQAEAKAAVDAADALTKASKAAKVETVKAETPEGFNKVESEPVTKEEAFNECRKMLVIAVKYLGKPTVGKILNDDYGVKGISELELKGLIDLRIQLEDEMAAQDIPF